MSTGIVVLNFGEPGEPQRDQVLDYLERIFYANAELEDAETDEQRRNRSRKLAERRVSGLLEEYEKIGGSPLNEQAKYQAELIESELTNRGYDVTTYLGMQYTEPFIDDAARAAFEDDVEKLIGLPIYPLCGPSTTVLALDELQEALDELGWEIDLQSITGWHKHPTYNRIRAEQIQSFVADHDVDLTDPSTKLVYSAHGTPQHYLESGSRYDIYVEEYCETNRSLLGVSEYELGYQNHGNRDIPWTEPELEELVSDLDAETIVVEPISFLHEQSETLSELDIELVEDAIDAGQTFYRVPIPHDDERIGDLFADLIEPLIAEFDPSYYQLRQCQCRDEQGTLCLNAPRESSR